MTDCLKFESEMDIDAKLKVDNVANGIREPSELPSRIVQLMN